MSNPVSNYFVLKCMAGAGPLQFKLESDADNKECWQMGMAFSPDHEDSDFHPPTDVLELQTKIDSKAPERIYPELTWNPLPLMSRRLVTALQSAGVDNLQVYETRIANPQNGAPADFYLCVNIVGAVAAANMAESQFNPDVEDRLISADFTSLTVQPEKSRDLLIFRLAENTSAVLVHERVRRFIESRGIDSLTWFEPESWAG
ncbi:hypothetical protein HNQ60_000797 [Povalibacter uvarum]|uniref:Immunity MXAN-0049 protein domain-containing protein n=1 Tax=Povalibacter uvarum TaxID=732238 RepID=A0A841HFR4_9GAMM|nr:DUF1629 domain-containing protein [Povalibacter uvarum]MBB6091951.1 hypothetical protein [Povalibacter uvarum]